MGVCDIAERFVKEKYGVAPYGGERTGYGIAYSCIREHTARLEMLSWLSRSMLDRYGRIGEPMTRQEANEYGSAMLAMSGILEDIATELDGLADLIGNEPLFAEEDASQPPLVV